MSETNPQRRLWGIGTPRTLRPHWMLIELGLEYETRKIITRSDDMRAPAFRALSDRGKIPLFEDGPLMIGESAAIVLYLADRYRHVASLAPLPGSDERARHDELCFFVMTEMDALLYTIRRHAGLPEIYGESEVAVRAAEDYFLRSAGEVESRLRDGRPHLLGDDFSVADLLLKTCLDWAGFVGIAIPEALARYAAAIGERPAFGVAMKVNFPPEALAALA
jgi:glutathione S-transferase